MDRKELFKRPLKRVKKGLKGKDRKRRAERERGRELGREGATQVSLTSGLPPIINFG